MIAYLMVHNYATMINKRMLRREYSDNKNMEIVGENLGMLYLTDDALW